MAGDRSASQQGQANRLLAGCSGCSCLFVVAGMVLILPLGLFALGAVFMVQSRQAGPGAEAFRAAPACSSTNNRGSPRCFEIRTGVVDSVTSQPGRGPQVRQDLTLRLSDEQYSTRVDVWLWDMNAIQPGQSITARLDQNTVTEIRIGSRVLTTRDNPAYLNANARDGAYFTWALGTVILGLIAFAGRKEWPGLIGAAAAVWPGRAVTADGDDKSSAA